MKPVFAVLLFAGCALGFRPSTHRRPDSTLRLESTLFAGRVYNEPSPGTSFSGIYFETCIAQLKNYRERHGNCLVPEDYVVRVEGGVFPLGKWVKSRAEPDYDYFSEQETMILGELGFYDDLLDRERQSIELQEAVDAQSGIQDAVTVSR